MARFKFIVLPVLAVLLVYALKSWFFVSEADLILKQLRGLEQAASFEGKRHPLEDLAASKEICSFFAEDVKAILFEEAGEREVVSSREGLKEKIMAVRTHLDQFAFKILSPQVEVHGDRAEVTLTARGMGREPGRTDYFLEEHRAIVRMKKVSGRWLIAEARNLDSIDVEERTS